MSSKLVALAIGSHTWTPDNTTELDKLLDVMRKHKIGIIDTARSYVCKFSPCHAEIGQIAKPNVVGPRRI